MSSVGVSWPRASARFRVPLANRFRGLDWLTRLNSLNRRAIYEYRMKPLEFNAVLEGDEDGYYAYYLELKGCQTQGQTVGEALSNLREAAELYLETLSPADLEMLASNPRTILSALQAKFLRWLGGLRRGSGSETDLSAPGKVSCAQTPRLTAAEAEKLLLQAGFVGVGSKGIHRMYQRQNERIAVPFQSDTDLHPKIVLDSEYCKIRAEKCACIAAAAGSAARPRCWARCSESALRVSSAFCAAAP